MADPTARQWARQALKASALASPLIASYSSAGAAAANIPLPSGYIIHELIAVMVPANSADEIRMRVTTDNFSTVKSGGTDYSSVDARITSAGTNTITASAGQAYITLDSAQGNTAARAFMGQVDVFGAALAGYPTEVSSQHGRMNGGGTYNKAYGTGGRYLTAEAVNGLQFYASTGNLAYEIYVYGRPSS